MCPPDIAGNTRYCSKVTHVKYPHRLLEDVDTLASFKGWSKEVYEDFFRLQRGEIEESEFREKYSRERAILSIDMTGFTISTVKLGEMQSLTRILDAQRVAIPVMQDYGAELVRCFADDIVALFLEPDSAVDAALEIHRRVQLFNASSLASEHPTLCCAGVGYGRVLAIGPNLAQGDEMNRASKLGEDVARGKETLVTERVHDAVSAREDIIFERQDHDDLLFPFYRVTEPE
jgi:class 3 adenylate cyclase